MRIGARRELDSGWMSKSEGGAEGMCWRLQVERGV